MRLCVKCNVEKSVENFYIAKRTENKIYRKHVCIICDKERGKIRRKKYQKQQYANRKRKIKSNYDLQINRYKFSLKRRHKEKFDLTLFDVTDSFIKTELSKPCSYCKEDGIKMTIDRKNSLEGYTIQNCVGSCIRCNTMKSNMPYEAWINLVPSILNTRELGLFSDWVGPKLGTINDKMQEG